MNSIQITFLCIFSIGLAILVFMFLKTLKAEKTFTKEEMQKLQAEYDRHDSPSRLYKQQ
jgi:hypothetical protein